MQDGSEKVLIIDGSFFSYFYHFSPKIEVEGQEVQAIVRALSSIRQFIAKGWQVEIVWDGHAQWRYDLLSQYKSDRKKNIEVEAARIYIKKNIIPKLMRILMCLPVTQRYSPSQEADDLAAQRVFSAKAEDAKTRFRLLCSDSDWLQLVGPNCDWWDFRAKKVITHTMFGAEDFYTCPYQIAEAKILSGDKSDSIPGVRGIAEKRALYLLNKYNGLDNLIKALEVDAVKENKNFLGLYDSDFYDIIARNKKLIVLQDKQIPDLVVRKGVYDQEAVAKYFDIFSMQQEAKEWQSLMLRSVQEPLF